MDVVTAPLHPEIDQPDILMNLPELHDLGDLSEFDLTGRNQVVRLRKALYGLKQPPRLWHKEIDSFLLSLNFTQSLAEPNLYLTNNVMILLYVDHLQLFFNCREKAEEIKGELKEKYRMTDLGPTPRFLDMDIDTMESGFALYQTPYIESLLQRFKMTDAYGVDTPIDCNVSVTETLLGRGGDTLQGCAHNSGLPSGAPERSAARIQGERPKRAPTPSQRA